MRILIHTIRLSLFAGIIACLFVSSTATPNKQPLSLTTIPLQFIQDALPTAVTFGGPSPTVKGAVELTNGVGEPVGYCFQTSPMGDSVIGFSGPSNLLIICNRHDRICGISILSSSDTRDHVSSVRRDEAFWDQFIGEKLDTIKIMSRNNYQTTAGATLTSHAMVESITRRLGGTARSTRFTARPSLIEIQKLFPQANRLRFDAGDPSIINVYNATDIPLGWTLRTSPAADSLIGYQGPTDTLVGFDTTGTVIGLCILQSFDNEPYVGYVRDDRGFANHFIGQTFESLSQTNQDAPPTEGVSGATMTSQTIAQAIITAAHSAHETQPASSFLKGLPSRLRDIDAPQWGALLVVLCGLVVGFTRLRGHWVGRIVLPLVVLGYLGFGAGALLSQAQLWGWATHGIPQAAPVLLLLSIVAIVTPATTGRNLYCSQLCAHGAAQQLLKISLPNRQRGIVSRLRKRIAPILKHFQWLPWILFILCLLITVFDAHIPLVDFEPFDAYLPAVAGTAAIVIFALSLAVSSISPMAYCRHACPTGALLSFIRFNRTSSKLTWQDGILCVCFFLALITAWSSGARVL